MTDNATDATLRARGAWKPAFLEALAESGMVSEACAKAGVNRSTAYRARQADEAFALAWADVEERATEELERVVLKRAIEGSDTLAMFLLKARRPEKYRENVKVEHAGSVARSYDGVDTDTLRERARALLSD